jgi:serine/threonine protein kinase
MWMKKILLVAQFIHFQELGHNDFKVENMLVFRKNVLKACDMDLMDSFGVDRKREVSPYICSPEIAAHIIRDTGLKVDSKADIWCIGVMAFYMRLGRKPFDDFLMDGASCLEDMVKPMAQLTQEGTRSPTCIISCSTNDFDIVCA